MQGAEESTINVPCSRCRGKTARLASWVKTHDEFVCPRCGASTNLAADGLRAQLAAAARDWQRFWCDWDELPEPAQGNSTAVV